MEVNGLDTKEEKGHVLDLGSRKNMVAEGKSGWILSIMTTYLLAQIILLVAKSSVTQWMSKQNGVRSIVSDTCYEICMKIF